MKRPTVFDPNRCGNLGESETRMLAPTVSPCGPLRRKCVLPRSFPRTQRINNPTAALPTHRASGIHPVQHIRKSLWLGVVFLTVAAAQAGPWQIDGGRAPSPKRERDLIAVLRSDAPKAKKADACKDLAVYGSRACVPELARLLADEQLASWARIAWEAIPGPEADEALRKALPSLRGLLLVGATNSIGVRRDAGAVDLLIGRLRDADAEVASAAAAALGRIGNQVAAQALEQSLPSVPPDVRSAVAEGLVLCAERSLAEGQAAQAVALYDLVRKSDVPKQRMLEATRGAILARRQDGIPLLIEQLRSPDKAFLQLAL